jgi:hypothetical protein
MKRGKIANSGRSFGASNIQFYGPQWQMMRKAVPFRRSNWAARVGVHDTLRPLPSSVQIQQAEVADHVYDLRLKGQAWQSGSP